VINNKKTLSDKLGTSPACVRERDILTCQYPVHVELNVSLPQVLKWHADLQREKREGKGITMKEIVIHHISK
jgi:hypothetical protein